MLSLKPIGFSESFFSSLESKGKSFKYFYVLKSMKSGFKEE